MTLIKDILKGILIGIANIIPGVSGGTMAVSMGIYDVIIGAVTNIFKDFKNSIKTLWPYGVGMLLGLGGLSFIIGFLFEKFPLQTSMTFIGLILGGLPILFGKVKGTKVNIVNIFIFLTFFLIVSCLPLISKDTKEVQLNLNIMLIIQLLLIGTVASATMVIPGVSGSMILMILGFYEPIIQTVKSFIEHVFAFNISGIMNGIYILLPFGIGVIGGVFAIAKLIEILLNKFHTSTYYAILGLVIASPITILYNTNLNNINFLSIVTSFIVFLMGFFIAFTLGKE